MTQIRFGGQSAADPFGYKAARWTYQLPEKAKTFLTPKVGEKVAGFVGDQLKSDFSSYTSVPLGRFKALLAEPPRLPLLLLLYPGTVGPRVYRAYQRGKEENDFREVKDVLRRDLTAITLFVFALSPLVNTVSKFMQGRTGVNLIKPKGGVLSYSDFRNYQIDNHQALWQVVKEGNGKGLQNAINGLTDGGLEKKHGEAKVASVLKELKASVSSFVHKYAPKENVPIDDKAALNAAEGTFDLFDKFDTAVKETWETASKDLQENGSKSAKSVMSIATNLQGQAKGALANYAKVRRLPSDMLSFAVLIGCIGWLPMWINGVLNKKEFEKGQATLSKSNLPKSTLPHANSAAPNTPVQQVTPVVSGFRPQPMAFQTGFSPFTVAQRPVNPFIRQA